MNRFKLHRLFCVFLLLASFLFEAPALGKRPLGIMMELGRTRDNMVRDLNEETSRYEAVKKALVRGKLERGQSAQDIAGEYGEPVISTTRSGIDEWVYKPGNKSFFDGEKIYLYFDADGKLLGWEDLTAS